MLKTIGAIMPFLVLAVPALAQDKGLALEWHGKPVSPACFSYLLLIGGEPSLSVNLETCSELDENADGVIRIEDGNIVSLDYGRGYDSYVVNAIKGEDYLVTYMWNGGGAPGQFSSAMKVRINGDMLSAEEYFGDGDRCNGGVIDLEFDKDGKVISTVWATPADFPSLAYKEYRGLVAYEDLEASELSCFAQARKKDGLLYDIQLEDAVDKTDTKQAELYTYQPCFNRVFEEQRIKKDRLDRTGFIKFMDHFFEECVPEKKQ